MFVPAPSPVGGGVTSDRGPQSSLQWAPLYVTFWLALRLIIACDRFAISHFSPFSADAHAFYDSTLTLGYGQVRP
jgi:hypothetical protein